MNKKAKYRNKKTEVNGVTFDSAGEAKRYQELLLMEKAGIISDLQRQVKFVLTPKQEGERESSYLADFVYLENGERVVEDYKGMKTDAYILKRKFMLFFHGIRIREISA